MQGIEDEGIWMWVSFAPESRLIIDFILRSRKQYVAEELIKTADKCLQIQHLFSLQVD